MNQKRKLLFSLPNNYNTKSFNILTHKHFTILQLANTPYGNYHEIL